MIYKLIGKLDPLLCFAIIAILCALVAFGIMVLIGVHPIVAAGIAALAALAMFGFLCVNYSGGTR